MITDLAVGWSYFACGRMVRGMCACKDYVFVYASFASLKSMSLCIFLSFYTLLLAIFSLEIHFLSLTFMRNWRKSEKLRSISSPFHQKYGCFASLSIVCFLHSSLCLSDAAALCIHAFTQGGCVLTFLTQIIFGSITLRMPSHLSNIKLL